MVTRSFPPERIVCLTEETVETLYSNLADRSQAACLAHGASCFESYASNDG